MLSTQQLLNLEEGDWRACLDRLFLRVTCLPYNVKGWGEQRLGIEAFVLLEDLEVVVDEAVSLVVVGVVADDVLGFA